MWWRAANYLSVGQIYMMGVNPLLRQPLTIDQIKPRLLGHWGTTPGLNFIYAHLNRVIRARDLAVIYVCGPGHGGPGMVASTWLEGSYTEMVPHITQDEAGMGKLFKQFSFPGGIPSHDAANVPGSINEGGELGYSLLHAAGAVFDNPDLIAACVVGDGEAETGAMAASWHVDKFLNPARDGAVLPILHLNGYKIAGPTVLARIPEEELLALFKGYGWAPVVVAGHEPGPMHRAMAKAMDDALDSIAAIQKAARGGDMKRPAWPMIILRSPKGWTGPKTVDNKPVEGTWRAHQVPLDRLDTHPERLRQLEEWMRSYRPEELFDAARPPGAGHPGAGTRGQPAHGHEPARQWRPAAAGARSAGFPRLRGGRPGARRPRRGGHPRSGRLRARRDAAEHADLPAVRPGRDCEQPAGSRVQGDPASKAWANCCRPTRTWAPRVASWRC